MLSRRSIVFVCYALNAVVSLVLGSVYLLKDTFMPYHESALGLGWSELGPSFRVLIEALMDVAGAGWIGVGLATAVLLIFPFREGKRWSRFLIPALLLTFYVPTLFATLKVLYYTPAQTPWYGNAIACLTTIIGFMIDRPWRTTGLDF